MEITTKLIFLFILLSPITSECSYGCLLCDTKNDVCLFCDIQLNYTVEANSCLRVNYENCASYSVDGICLYCVNGFYLDPVKFRCKEILEENQIENCHIYATENSCMNCNPDHYLNDGKCAVVPNIMKGCTHYMNGKADTCLLCDSGYRLSRDGKNCIPEAIVKNCQKYTDIVCDTCLAGYVYNDNMYINNILELTNDSQRAYLIQWLYTNTNIKIDKCRAVSISNCSEYASFSTCKVCASKYFITKEKTCVGYPLDGIPNCAVYENPQKCLQCVEGFFLETDVSCQQVSTISGCSNYNTSAKTSICVKCTNDNILDELGVCNPRTETIDNCIDYHATLNKCLVCTEGFKTTDDSVKCVNTIPDCDEYEFSNIFTDTSSCKFCSKGLTFLAEATRSDGLKGKCLEGSVPNCDIYQAENICYTCAFGYSLQGTDCLLNNVVEFCENYERDKLHTCQTCNPNYMLFNINDICTETAVIANCDTFSSPNKCQKCKNGFKIMEDTEIVGRDKCDLIPVTLNCVQYDNSTSKCTLCDKAYVLDEGVCKKTQDYLQEYCASDNMDGLINLQEFKCNHCDQFSSIVDVNSYFICTSEKYRDDLIENCGKYKRDQIDLTFKCIQCKEGFYLQDEKCVTECSSEKIKIIEELTKGFVLNSQSSSFDMYKVSGLRKCETLTGAPSNCEIVAPNIFFQNTDETIVDYVCIQCKLGFISVPAPKTATRYNSGDIENSISGPLPVYPGLSCVSSQITISGQVNDATNLIENCQYYYKLNKNTSQIETYGCLRCKFGYTGVIINSDYSNFSGFLDTCEPFPENECDLDVKYQGYTQDFEDLENWLIPLSSYLTCHKCKDNAQKPVLFIDYDVAAVDTGFNVTPASPNNYDYYKYSTWKNYAGINKYSLTSSPYRNGSGGKMNVCMVPNNTNFNMSGGNYFRILNGDNAGDNCALFISQVYYSPSAYYSYVSGSVDFRINNVTLTCGACMPSYRKYKTPKTYGNTNQTYVTYFYHGYECSAISNCDDTGKDWVNYCSKCLDGYVWNWNTSSKRIEYDNCRLNSIKNCQAAASNTVCSYCEKGYVLHSDGYCEKYTSPFCDDNYSLFTVEFEANSSSPIYIDLGRSGLYLHPHPPGCNSCKTGYAAYEQPGSKFVCLKSQFLLDHTNLIGTITTGFVENCKNYYYETSGNTITCVVCEDSYTLTITNKCVQASTVNNCAYASEITSNGETTYSCETCLDGFIFVSGLCTEGTIVNCKTYTISKTAKTQNCAVCNDGYYSAGSTCIQGSIANCLVYDSATNCISCSSGFQSIKLKDNVSLCLEIPVKMRCKGFDEENFSSGDLSCSECNPGYVAVVKTINDPSSYCFKFPGVDNCFKYNREAKFSKSTLECTQCNLEFFLNLGNKQCVSRSPIDPNCTYLHITSDECLKCKTSYFLDTDKLTCIKNPEGINFCRTYSDAVTCVNCNKDKFLENNTCLDIPVESKVANCLYYNETKECIECEETFALESKKCIAGIATNCLTYETAKKCATCKTGFGKFTENDNINCIPFTDENCAVSTLVHPFECLQCNVLYYPKDGLCVDVDSKIKFCLVYDTANTCAICESAYALSIDKKTCDTNEFISSFKDVNCERNRLVSPAECAACQVGYYFKDNSCLACNITAEEGCFYCNPEEPTTCLLCASRWYMDKTGKCVANPHADDDLNGGGNHNNSTNTTDPNDKGIKRIAVFVTVLFWLLFID